ncbi:D-inositol-3-phosphate glycosyltransferase [uncultured archaeon]|nr:D-inositol-3-phosphate glycosyltransferase [uncultured archaeon]
MNIAILTASDPDQNVGGVELYIKELTNALKKDGHKIDVISPKKKIGGHLSLTWTTLRFCLTSHDLSSYDLVISNSHSLRLITKTKRVVSIFHGSGLQRFFTDKKAYFSPFTYVDAAFEVLDLILTERIVCINERLKKFLTKIENESKMHVIYPGVDTEQFKPKKRTQETAKKILFVGRLTKSKGFADLVDALNYLPQEYSLIAVGGDEVKEVPRIKYAGKISHENLPAYYNICDVFCLPSRSEGTPLTLLEAMACGCPVVATPVGGIPEIVTYDAGILTPVGKPKKLAESIIEAAKKDRVRVRNTALKYSWRQIARTIIEVGR